MSKNKEFDKLLAVLGASIMLAIAGGAAVVGMIRYIGGML